MVCMGLGRSVCVFFWNVDVLEYLGHEMEKFYAYFSVA
jgi:hypothetical protein